jgi:ubiquitin-conjugating enzyme E2 S
MAKGLSLAATKTLTKQLVELTTKPCEGISVEFAEENIREIYADIEGPTGTPFEGGVFRVKLLLGDDFPDAPPKGFFLTKVFHPNISEAGDICVNVLKKDWKPDLGIRHVLLVGPLPDHTKNILCSRSNIKWSLVLK